MVSFDEPAARTACIQAEVTAGKRAQAELADRLRFETLLADLSARFVNVPAEQLHAEVNDAQRLVCECLGLEVASLWHRPEASAGWITLTHLYRAMQGPVMPARIDARESIPWTYRQIVSGQVAAFSSLADLPPEAAREREFWRQLGVKAGVTIGLSAGGSPPVGIMSFNTVRAERTWADQIVNRLQLVAQMLSSALARQRAEVSLRERETILRTFVRHSPAAIAMLDLDLRYLVVSRRWLTDYQLPNRDILGRSHYEVFPEIPDRWKDIHRRCLAGAVERCEEDPFPRSDGSLDWIRWEVRPWRRADASIGGIIIFSEILTERKQTREELQKSLEQLRALAGRLQSVREEERKRVARDIHDQLGQALTAIKLDLGSLLRDVPGTAPLRTKRGKEIMNMVDATIKSVRRIATELRPGILDDLGLAAAVEWVTDDFEARTGTKCRLSIQEGQEEIKPDPEVSTAVFRILQETLTNVARHAVASETAVRLGSENGDLILEVRDNGIGTSDAQLSSRRSLGILGMRERALLLGGTLQLSGHPGKGTTVHVRIPLRRAALVKSP